LEQRINDTLDKNEQYVKQLYEVKDRGVTIVDNQKDTVPGLYNLLWQPLDSLLAGINTIYYAPAGLLNRINLAAINYSGKKVLGDKYAFHLVGSTRDIVSYKSQSIENRNDTLLLYGGIQFDMDSSSLVEQHKKYYSTPTLNDGIAVRSGNSYTWLPIDGSAEELSSIQALAASQKIPTHSFTQKEATEESFIFYTHQTRSPALIHIASHGFFYPDEQRRKLKEEGKDAPYFMSSANVFQRSGIVFAGANQVTSGKDPIQGIEDGIVTAYDISNANLQNTKLMVLSACETGLGKIENTEGVFGLQRAIRMAGCKNLLMSLWKVPDEQTSRFMGYFYTQLLQEKKTIYDSFQFAQKQMRELYSGQPYNWAGFVLME
jgi:CHAT domain-containing protein